MLAVAEPERGRVVIKLNQKKDEGAGEKTLSWRSRYCPRALP